MPRPIFQARSKRRLVVLRVVSVLLILASLGWLSTFGAHLYFIDKLPGSSLAVGEAPAYVASKGTSHDIYGNVDPETCETSPFPPILPSGRESGYRQWPTQQVTAFLPYLPESTYASLEAGAKAIDVLMPEWFRVSHASEGAVALRRDVEHQVYLRRLIDREAPRMRVMPVVTLYQDAIPGGEEGALDRTALAQELAHIAAVESFKGLVLMPRGTRADESAALAAFARELDTALNARGIRSYYLTGIDDEILKDPGFVAAIDQVILKAFREPRIGAPPSPLAPQRWFEQNVRRVLETYGQEKFTFMLGNFAVDWSRREAAPDVIPVSEAFRRLGVHGGNLDFPQAVGNLRLRFTDTSGAGRELWVLDAVSLHNQLARLADLGVKRVGFWSLGYEDPSVWPLLSVRVVAPEPAARLIADVDFSDFVGYDGAGPFQYVISPAVKGERFVSFDPETELIRDQSFSPLPEPWSIQRFGRAAPDEIAITFDDGPDEKYTAEILDILKDRDAKATFFVVGTRLLKSPGLVQRRGAEGHEVGSHTFMHPSIEDHPALRTVFELNALQRLLATITGRGTLLFRTPFGRSEGPLTGADAAPIRVVGEAGYIVVGSDIVPPDWLHLESGEIVDYVMAELAENGGNVIVLHDSGGDRQATVDAVGPIIDRLRADGYRIVTLADMLGAGRDVVMPPASTSRWLLDKASFGLIGGMSEVLIVTFWVAITLGVLRGTMILTLAFSRRRHPAPAIAEFAPKVTVVIPAYNEEKTILHCIDSVLASDYPDLEVIVVDDGSTDHTYADVKAFAESEPRIRLIQSAHGGKWFALDVAYSHIRSEIVVAIDADSMLAPDAISRMVPHFADPAVGAVAGRVKVGNQRNLLTRLQALEYMTAQGVDRRAFERLNAILVVPGAIGAWRAEAVRAANLYSPETVTEDADLTVSVIRAGYRVVYEETAYAVTEAPETISAFLRQRLRWSFGMLQTARKHIVGAIRQRLTVGMVSLPDLLVIGYGFSILAPVADLVLIGTLVDLGVDQLLDRPVVSSDVRFDLILAYLFLPLFDVLVILVAMRFDRSESRLLLLLVPFQRFFYRQLLYFTAWRAMIRALAGRIAGWGRLVRTGNGRLPLAARGVSGPKSGG